MRGLVEQLVLKRAKTTPKPTAGEGAPPQLVQTPEGSTRPPNTIRYDTNCKVHKYFVLKYNCRIVRIVCISGGLLLI